MPPSKICTVCSSEEKKNKPLLKCEACMKEVHISCTTSKKTGARVLCLLCRSNPPSSSSSKREKEKQRQNSSKEEDRETRGRASTGNNSTNTKPHRSSITSKPGNSSSSNKPARSSSSNVKPRGSMSHAISPAMAVSPPRGAANSAGHKLRGEVKMGNLLDNSPATPGATYPQTNKVDDVGNEQDANSPMTALKESAPLDNSGGNSSAVQRVAVQQETVTPFSNLSRRRYTHSNGDTFSNILNKKSIQDGAIAASVVEFTHNTHVGIGRMLKELRLAVEDKIDSLKRDVAILPAQNKLIVDLTARLSSLESLVQAQSSKLEELKCKNSTLIDANVKLENKIVSLEGKISTMEAAQAKIQTYMTHGIESGICILKTLCLRLSCRDPGVVGAHHRLTHRWTPRL